MNAADLRRIALALPEATESSHFGKADFRVRDRIFASLPADDRGVLKLTRDEQAMLTGAEPSMFAPVPGGWGSKGWTSIFLDAADETTLGGALAMAWRNAAPRALAKSFAGAAAVSRRKPMAMQTRDESTGEPAGPPLAEPGPWSLVAGGYSETTRHFLALYSESGLARLAIDPASRVIDVACGPGTTAIPLAARVSEIACVDFSQDMLERLRAYAEAAGVANLDIRHADGQALPYPDASFDLGISMFGLMYFPDRARGFSELHRVLRPGGRALVSSWAPAAMSPLTRVVIAAVGGGRSENGPPAPSGLESPEIFRAEMEAAGFAGIEILPATHGMEVRDIGEFWRDTVRGTAPLAWIRDSMGGPAWSDLEDEALERLRRALPSLPVTLTATAYLATAVKPA